MTSLSFELPSFANHFTHMSTYFFNSSIHIQKKHTKQPVLSWHCPRYRPSRGRCAESFPALFQAVFKDHMTGRIGKTRNLPMKSQLFPVKKLTKTNNSMWMTSQLQEAYIDFFPYFGVAFPALTPLRHASCAVTITAILSYSLRFL